MAWTSAADLAAQTQKLWDKGTLLSELVVLQTDCIGSFPRRLQLRAPTTPELAARFEDVRAWAESLRHNRGHYRLVEHSVRSPVLGNNRIPSEVWLDTLADALALIGKTKDAARFVQMVRSTQNQQPLLLPWLSKRAHTAMALLDVWPRLLAVVSWLRAHPRPGIYLRQADIVGVDSKLIEAHRSTLAELFDLALPLTAIDPTATGVLGFCQRYGFLDKPRRIRFRWLGIHALPYGEDITMSQTAFEQLNAPVNHVFITENEVNFLAFPNVPNSMVIFGGGFGGLDRLRCATWLHQRSVHYWGDIDTHGFAMLDQLRAYLPQVTSLLMDKATLMHHQDHWGHEPQAQRRDLPRLTTSERAVYDLLRDNHLRAGLRLEQERIGFGWLGKSLEQQSTGEHTKIE